VPPVYQPRASSRPAQAKPASASRRQAAPPPVFKPGAPHPGGNVPVNVLTHAGNKTVK
jgi:hypothetical protein